MNLVEAVAREQVEAARDSCLLTVSIEKGDEAVNGFKKHEIAKASKWDTKITYIIILDSTTASLR